MTISILKYFVHYSLSGVEGSNEQSYLAVAIVYIAVLNHLRNYCRGNPPVVALIDKG